MDFYIFKDDQNLGPLTADEVSSGLKSGKFGTDDLACRVGEDRWVNLDFFFPSPANEPHSWMKPENSSRPSTTNLPINDRIFESNRPSTTGPLHSLPAYSNPPVQHVVHHYETEPEGALPKIALVGGIVLFCMMIVGLVPCLGWLNWITLFVGGVLKVICWVAVLTTRNRSGRNKALIGLLLVIFALIIGGIRLVIGSGCV